MAVSWAITAVMMEILEEFDAARDNNIYVTDNGCNVTAAFKDQPCPAFFRPQLESGRVTRARRQACGRGATGCDVTLYIILLNTFMEE